MLCLIHGKWHDGSSWGAFRAVAGEESVAPDLPLDDPSTTYETRAKVAIDAVADAGDVVVMAHSLGAAYAPIVASARPVRRIVYLCPAPVGVLGAPAPMRREQEGFPWPRPDASGITRWEPEAAVAAMYPRLEPDVARAAVESLRPAAAPAGEYPLDRHPDVPVSFVYAAQDEFFPPDWSRWAARELLGVEPIELPTGHFPMLEDPAGLARAVANLV